MSETSVQERLARRLYETWDETNVPWNLRAPDDPTRQIFAEGVDAILAELAEPTDGMIEAACPDTLYDTAGRQGEDVCKFMAGWRWAVEHIRDGGS